MKNTAIFISGWAVPKWAARSKLIWDESLWKDYKCIWLDSRTPTSDVMVKWELDQLQYVVSRNPGCALIGQSLGGWWAANLALRPDVYIRKTVLWTPVCDASAYPIFKVSREYHPPYQFLTQNQGPHRVLTLSANRDLLTPADAHGHELSKHFSSMTYTLRGGHFFQSNHKPALQYMKDWIET